jgi:AraC-like DNA-binding protein
MMTIASCFFCKKGSLFVLFQNFRTDTVKNFEGMNHPNVAWINDVNLHYVQQPVNANGLYYSRLLEAEGNNAFRNVSIKYVLEGSEYYCVNGTEYKVEAGSFLLANQCPDGRVYFQSKKPVSGICIDLNPSILHQAMQALAPNNQQDPDSILEQQDNDVLVMEQLYQARYSPLHRKLCEAERMTEKETTALGEEWFFELAELIATQEQAHHRALRALDVVKRSTRDEIYRRLLRGREYMNEYYLQSPQIAQVAQQCFMSEFYFFRCFRQAFGITPHQYMLRKRLKLAAQLMEQKQMSISRVAMECGFPDLSTFSKTFKKHYRITPTQYVASV